MAFDQSTRNRLHRFVSQSRAILMEEFTRQLQATYGMDPANGTVADVDTLGFLDNEGQQTAVLLRETLAHYTAAIPGKSEKDKIRQGLDRIIREQSFTVLNRLAALRMAEARGFLIQSIAKGTSSKGFQLYKNLAGTALGETGDAFRCFLFSLFDEFSLDLAVLFDRHSVQGRLFPREAALLALLEQINHFEIEPLWAEDETIGWIYQYFNSQEERKQMRKASQAPRNSRELAVRNQFFTPRYVVEFLTDNTLGRIWYEMTQGHTALKDICRYLVRRPNEIFLAAEATAPETVEENPEDLSQEELLKQPVYVPFRRLKDPRELRMLDPACGSMHFGLYAFDLFETIYEEAWHIETDLGPDVFDRSTHLKPLQETYVGIDEFKKAIPQLIIEQNIHGVDIDPRAVQIAGLSLWQRAQRSWHQMGIKPGHRPAIRKSNIVCAEPMPGEKEMLREFTAGLNPPVLGQLVETIFDKMQLAGEAGTLLKIEQEITSAITDAKEAYNNELLKQKEAAGYLPGMAPKREPTLFDFAELHHDGDFWETAEEKILTALKNYAAQAESHEGQKRLFAEDAAKGFAFIDLCRKRFDVVLMNPPFGAPVETTRKLFKQQYPLSADNVAVAFMERGKQLLLSNSFTGSITDCSWVKKYDYRGFRSSILLESDLYAIVHLGWSVLDNANVETNLTIRGGGNNIAFTVNLFEASNKGEDLAVIVNKYSPNFLCPFQKFKYLPNHVFAFEMEDDEFVAYKSESFVSKSFMKAVAGIKSCNSNADFRTWWEIPNFQLGDLGDWNYLHNGSPYCPFHYPVFFVVRSDKGKWTHILAKGGATPGKNYYKKAGISFGKRTEIMYGYVKPERQVFSQEGQAIFPIGDVSIWEVLSLVNSSIFSRHANYVAGQHKYHNYLNNICLPINNLPTEAINNTKEAYKKLWLIDQVNENTNLFVSPFSSEEFKLGNNNAERISRAQKIFSFVIERQEKNDKIISEALNLGLENKPIKKVDYYNHYFGESFSAHLVAITWFSYFVGVVFGRWDIRYATGDSQSPDLPDPFDPLPVCPPGMLQNSDGLPATPDDVPADYPLLISWPGILVNDDNSPEDISLRIRDAIAVIWKENAELIEQEACDILGTKTLQDYFARPTAFFADHLKRYSKSRRQAPIYWPLQTPSGSYTLWVYYHRLTDQTLYTCVNDFVEQKLKTVSDDLTALRNQTTRSSAEEKELATLSDLENELKDFRDELLHIAGFWKPDLNDGVQITAAPLWKLFQHRQWQNKLKDTWKKLENGTYDWAHLACSIWPERVLRKCHSDRSLAIAHDVENDFWEEIEVPVIRRGKDTGKTKLEWHPKPLTENRLQELIHQKMAAMRSSH